MDLKQEGYDVILVNSNPATVMTDPEFANRTYVEPLDADVLESIIAREKPDALLPTLGGQTGLNLALCFPEPTRCAPHTLVRGNRKRRPNSIWDDTKGANGIVH